MLRRATGAVLGWAAATATIAGPLPAPVIFAPGVISGPQNDGAPTFTPNGEIAYFERSYAHRAVILETHRQGGSWSTPVVASFSGPYSDQHPALSPDGRFLVYASARRRQAPANGHGAGYNHLWQVDRTPSGWSAPFELPPTVNISDLVFKPSVAANGDLYFMSPQGADANGPRWRIYNAARTPTGYAPAQLLPFSDGRAIDVDPFIAPDGSYLVFSSRGRTFPDDGHEHLFVSLRQNGGWGPVKALRYSGDDWGADDGESQVSAGNLYFNSARSAPVDRAENRQALLADIARAETWDNGNNNVWMLPLQALFKANGVERSQSAD